MDRFPQSDVAAVQAELGFAARAKRRLQREFAVLRDVVWWMGPEGRRHRRALRGLRGRYSGHRCWVLANGPSLRRTDVRLLKGEVTIGSNAIFLIFDQMGHQPT